MENKESTKTGIETKGPINLLEAMQKEHGKSISVPPAFFPKLPRGEVLKAATKTVAHASLNTSEVLLTKTRSLMNETFVIPVQPHLNQLKEDLSPLIEFFEKHPIYRGLAYLAMGAFGLGVLSYLTVNYGLYIIYLLA
jgi:hypothetical protein